MDINELLNQNELHMAQVMRAPLNELGFPPKVLRILKGKGITSLIKRVRLGNGKVVERRHDCWRADVQLVDCNGVRRIRRRFKDRDEALAWLGIYR